MTQAVAVDAIFGRLVGRANANFGDYLEAAERYMRLALKAQSHCRATVETLAAIKNVTLHLASWNQLKTVLLRIQALQEAE